MNKHVATVLRFLLAYDGWVTFTDNVATRDAVDTLENLGFAETNDCR